MKQQEGNHQIGREPPRNERICKYCILNKIEYEKHFYSNAKCTLYKERNSMTLPNTNKCGSIPESKS